MTATGDDELLPDPADPAPPAQAGRRRSADAIHEVCPYLVSTTGDWRSAYATRDHRCGAVEARAPLAIAKQRSLCLVAAHATCVTFQAADAAAGDDAERRSTNPADDGAGLWPATRSTPLLLEPARASMGPLSGRTPRGAGQALLIGLMGIALLVLVITRTTASPAATDPSSAPDSSAIAAIGSAGPSVEPASPDVSPSLVPSPSLEASPSIAPSPSVAASPSPTPSASPTVAPSPTPAASVRHYTVKSGDTLSGIAAKFGTTVKALKVANGITDPRVIHVGRVLIIP